MRILLVEDDSLLGDGVQAGLTQAGFIVDWVRDGRAAQLALETESYSLAVLDLGLPRVSGMEVLKHLRQRNTTTPVLILTARDTVSDRVMGLDAGGDDYLVKPFDLAELIARIRALLRRSAGRASSLIKYSDVTLDPASHVVTNNGAVVDLSPKEFSTLHILLQNCGRVLTRDQLEQHLYGWNEEIESNAVEVHIHHLRKKLGTDLIRTVRGVGYVARK